MRGKLQILNIRRTLQIFVVVTAVAWRLSTAEHERKPGILSLGLDARRTIRICFVAALVAWRLALHGKYKGLDWSTTAKVCVVAGAIASVVSIAPAAAGASPNAPSNNTLILPGLPNAGIPNSGSTYPQNGPAINGQQGQQSPDLPSIPQPGGPGGGQQEPGGQQPGVPDIGGRQAPQGSQGKSGPQGQPGKHREAPAPQQGGQAQNPFGALFGQQPRQGAPKYGQTPQPTDPNIRPQNEIDKANREALEGKQPPGPTGQIGYGAAPKGNVGPNGEPGVQNPTGNLTVQPGDKQLLVAPGSTLLVQGGTNDGKGGGLRDRTKHLFGNKNPIDVAPYAGEFAPFFGNRSYDESVKQGQQSLNKQSSKEPGRTTMIGFSQGARTAGDAALTAHKQGKDVQAVLLADPRFPQTGAETMLPNGIPGMTTSGERDTRQNNDIPTVSGCIVGDPVCGMENPNTNPIGFAVNTLPGWYCIHGGNCGGTDNYNNVEKLPARNTWQQGKTTYVVLEAHHPVVAAMGGLGIRVPKEIEDQLQVVAPVTTPGQKSHDAKGGVVKPPRQYQQDTLKKSGKAKATARTAPDPKR